jgi:hypothetical protein
MIRSWSSGEAEQDKGHDHAATVRGGVGAGLCRRTTPGFARGGYAHGAGRGGFVRDPTVRFGTGGAQTPTFENRIPAPLPAPAQAPIINGPMSQPAFRGLTGIGQ